MGTADFLWWAGPAATQAHRRTGGCRHRQYFLDPHLVLLVVAEVVGVGEPVVDSLYKIAQVDPPGLIGIPRATGMAQAKVLAPEMKAVQVLVLPAHYHLEDMMQLGYGGIAPHQHEPADLRTDTQ